MDFAGPNVQIYLVIGNHTGKAFYDAAHLDGERLRGIAHNLSPKKGCSEKE
jgi:hypothetical protein